MKKITEIKRINIYLWWKSPDSTGSIKKKKNNQIDITNQCVVGVYFYEVILNGNKLDLLENWSNNSFLSFILFKRPLYLRKLLLLRARAISNPSFPSKNHQER